MKKLIDLFFPESPLTELPGDFKAA